MIVRRLLISLTVLCCACSVTYVPPPKPIAPINEPSAAPTFKTSPGEAAGNVDCPTTTGGGSYQLFGASAPDFNAAHQGGIPLVRCSTDLKVIIMQLDISPPAPAAQVLATAEKELPADLKPIYDRTATGCRNLQFQSAMLQQVLGSDDPQGIVNVELESALAPSQAYDPNQVDTAVIHQQYDLNQVRPCLRG